MSIVAVGRRKRERRFTVLVDDVHPGAGAQQRLGHRSLAEMHGPRKRSGAVGLCGIDVGLGANQRRQRLLIAALHRFEHAEVLRGRCAAPPIGTARSVTIITLRASAPVFIRESLLLSLGRNLGLAAALGDELCQQIDREIDRLGRRPGR